MVVKTLTVKLCHTDLVTFVHLTLIDDVHTRIDHQPKKLHPPPYTSNSEAEFGIDNKAVNKELSDDNIKSAGLYFKGGSEEPHSNSNSNSANGGSVNSQDSLWNVSKNNHQQHQQQYHQFPLHQNHNHNQYHVDVQNDHGGYVQFFNNQQQNHDDYAHYPYPDEYIGNHFQSATSGEQFNKHNSSTSNRARTESNCKLKA